MALPYDEPGDNVTDLPHNARVKAILNLQIIGTSTYHETGQWNAQLSGEIVDDDPTHLQQKNAISKAL